ncbi:hypothetical protein QCB44_09875, partial [Thiomicrorhabdus sp. zzn3]|uniref:hypothetical protein n=1 Tax=Thiomicrorhabdus sp. zzn3 TaxID=3039775 RepID=UPI002436593E
PRIIVTNQSNCQQFFQIIFSRPIRSNSQSIPLLPFLTRRFRLSSAPRLEEVRIMHLVFFGVNIFI